MNNYDKKNWTKMTNEDFEKALQAHMELDGVKRQLADVEKCQAALKGDDPVETYLCVGHNATSVLVPDFMAASLLMGVKDGLMMQVKDLERTLEEL